MYKDYVNGLCQDVKKKDEIFMWIDMLETKLLYEHSQREVEQMLDYLILAKDAPTRLRKASIEQIKRLSDIWHERQTKKGHNIIETEQDVKVLIRWPKSGMTFVRLVGQSAYQREGALMSHCVASYYGQKDIKIYSLRDGNGMPHCTIEVRDNDVNQIKGKGNGSIHPKYVKYIIKILTKYFKLQVRDSEMNNLGYKYMEPEMIACLEDLFPGKTIPYLLFNGKKYIYLNGLRSL